MQTQPVIGFVTSFDQIEMDLLMEGIHKAPADRTQSERRIIEAFTEQVAEYRTQRIQIGDTVVQTPDERPWDFDGVGPIERPGRKAAR